MPSPGEDIQSWSTVAANNGTADPLIVWSEGQARASVNNSSRSEMAAHAKNRNLLNGSIVTTGTANAQQFLSGVGYTSMPARLVVRLKIGAGLTNTAATTLNMDGLGAVAIKTTDGVDLLGGELVANDYADLLWDGTNWVFLYSHEFFWERMTGGGGIIVGKQIFSTPGLFTYTPTALTECVIVECIGGGGGGGAAYASTGWGAGAPGGGGGGYSRSVLTAAQIGASQTVVIGAGGAGGTGVGPSAGAAGGFTSFGSLVIANGGSGGSAVPNPVWTSGASGAAVGLGDVAIAGSAGECGGSITDYTRGFAQGGSGGPGPFGGRGASVNINGLANGLGAPAGAYGGGGGGGVAWNALGVVAGGDGAGGLCIVTEFGGRGAPGRDGAPGAQGPIGPPGPAGAGTGDVLVSGTPVAGQIAEWVDSSHIRGIASSTGFTTGDAKLTLKTVADTGWVMMDDGTIGSATSGSSTRASADTQNLFTLLYNNINDANAPLLTSSGVATTRAAQGTAAAAFLANCRMTLTRQMGRSLVVGGAGAGLTSRTLGSFFGAETHVQTVAEMAQHSHTINGSFGYIYTDGTGHSIVEVGGTLPLQTTSGYVLNNDNAGSGNAMNIMNPSAVWNIVIKL